MPDELGTELSGLDSTRAAVVKLSASLMCGTVGSADASPFTGWAVGVPAPRACLRPVALPVLEVVLDTLADFAADPGLTLATFSEPDSTWLAAISG